MPNLEKRTRSIDRFATQVVDNCEHTITRDCENLCRSYALFRVIPHIHGAAFAAKRNSVVVSSVFLSFQIAMNTAVFTKSYGPNFAVMHNYGVVRKKNVAMRRTSMVLGAKSIVRNEKQGAAS